jgi:hypothetical protein
LVVVSAQPGLIRVAEGAEASFASSANLDILKPRLRVAVPSSFDPEPLRVVKGGVRKVCSMSQGEQYLVDRLQHGFIATFWAQVVLVVIVSGVDEPNKLFQYLGILLAEVDMAGGGFLHQQVSI